MPKLTSRSYVFQDTSVVPPLALTPIVSRELGPLSDTLTSVSLRLCAAAGRTYEEAAAAPMVAVVPARNSRRRIAPSLFRCGRSRAMGVPPGYRSSGVSRRGPAPSAALPAGRGPNRLFWDGGAGA